tara:strand:+ start:109 stop:456 length:348 start_codon:yes stop_codon:yes gene_type:complete
MRDKKDVGNPKPPHPKLSLDQQKIPRKGSHPMLNAISGGGTAILLAVARKMTLEHRGKAMRGGDPLADRRKATAALTFEQAANTISPISWMNSGTKSTASNGARNPRHGRYQRRD